MPLAMESDEAADLILTKLRSHPAEINFPASMTAVARAVAGLPGPLRDAALTRFPRPDEDADDGV